MLPLQLGKNAPGGRLIDRRSVPLGAGGANEQLPGLHSLSRCSKHRPADKIGADHGSGRFGKDAVGLPDGDVGHRFCGGCFHHEPPVQKVQACPGKLAALQKSVFACGQFFLRDSASGHQLHLLPQDRLSPRSLPGGQAACIHGPDKILRPDQQGNEQQNTHPQPAPPQKGPQPEVQPGAGLNAQPYPPLSGQCRKVSVLPGRAPARKAAGCRGDR